MNLRTASPEHPHHRDRRLRRGRFPSLPSDDHHLRTQVPFAAILLALPAVGQFVGG
jgi:hypothetical protein